MVSLSTLESIHDLHVFVGHLLRLCADFHENVHGLRTPWFKIDLLNQVSGFFCSSSSFLFPFFPFFPFLPFLSMDLGRAGSRSISLIRYVFFCHCSSFLFPFFPFLPF